MDTDLGTHPSFKGFRADVPQRAVAPLAVVVGFDVFEHGLSHLGAAHKALAMDALNLQAVEEAFRTRIVVAVAFRAHAAAQLMGSDQRLVGHRAVLAAAVAVHDHTGGLLASPQRHAQGIADQVGRHAFAHGPADHPPGIQINDHRQIQPAFFRVQVGDIAHPFLIRSRCREVLLEQVVRNGERVPGVGRGLELPGRFGAQSLPSHRGSNRLAIAGQPRVPQVMAKPWSSAAAFACAVGLRDPLIPFGPLLMACRGAA